MKRSPAAGPGTEAAPPTKRAQQTILVRMHDGEPVGCVPTEFADRIVTSGNGNVRRRGDRGYIRLLPGMFVQRSVHGWDLIERARRNAGDNAVRSGLRHLDTASETKLRWIPPTPAPC